MRTRLGLELAIVTVAFVALVITGCGASETVITETVGGNAATPRTAVADEPVDEVDEVDDDMSSTDTDTESSPQESDSIVEPTAVPDAPPATTPSSSDRCRYVEVDDFGDIQIEIDLVATEVREQEDTRVNYVVFSQAGAQIGTSTRLVEDLMPGERIRLAVDTLLDAPSSAADHDGITCDVVELEPFVVGPEPLRPVAGDTCQFVTTDSFGDIQIEVDVANPLSERTDLAVDYVLRGPDGTRFGDGVAYTDPLAPGERFPEMFDTLTEVPPWLNETEIVCEVLAIEDF